MNRPWHLVIGIFVLLVLWGKFELIELTLIFIPIAFTIFSDVDAGTPYHRNFLTHSNIIWFIVWFYNPSFITALVCLSVGVHCLLDVNLYPSSWKGMYLIKFGRHGLFWWSKGHQGRYSTLWLIGNFIWGIVVLCIQLGVIKW